MIRRVSHGGLAKLEGIIEFKIGKQSKKKKRSSGKWQFENEGL